MSPSAWQSLDGNTVYQNVVRGLIPASDGVTQVTSTSQQFRRDRALQSAAGSGNNVLVTTTILGNPTRSTAVLTQLRSSTSSGINVVTSSLRQIAGFTNVQTQPLVLLSSAALSGSPTFNPTASPTPLSTSSANNALSNQQSALGGSAGLPTSTLAAIIVVIVVVVVAAGFVAWRHSTSSSRKTIVVDPYGVYGGGGKRPSMSTTSPMAAAGQRRPSFGAPQTHQSGGGSPPARRQSRGSGIEMGDTYGVTGDNYGRQSLTEANPAFGRLSTSRASFSGGSRRSSFDGMAARSLSPGQKATRL